MKTKKKKIKLRTREIKLTDDGPEEPLARAHFMIGRASRQLRELQDTLVELAGALAKLS